MPRDHVLTIQFYKDHQAESGNRLPDKVEFTFGSAIREWPKSLPKEARIKRAGESTYLEDHFQLVDSDGATFTVIVVGQQLDGKTLSYILDLRILTSTEPD